MKRSSNTFQKDLSVNTDETLGTLPESDFTSSFGTYALGSLSEAIRSFSNFMPNSKFGRLAASGCRRLALFGSTNGLNGPVDVAVSQNLNARLYPGSNRCEKRAVAGIHHWDAEEIQTLQCAVTAKAGQDKPFVFFDVGANVGLYSLFVNQVAVRNNVPVQLIAVEPDPENRARLKFNASANQALIDIQGVAISDCDGMGSLGKAGANRGGVALTQSLEIGGVEVPLETLASMVKRLKVSHIDAMKVDIEGHDMAALLAFFSSVKQQYFPRILILETGRQPQSTLIDLAMTNGYQVTKRAGINTIMTFKDAV